MAERKVLGQDLHDVGVDVGILGIEVSVDGSPGSVGVAKRERKKKQLSTERGQHEGMRLHPGVKAINKPTAR